MAHGYSSSAARRAAKVSQRCLDHWDELGIVSPSIRRAGGKGNARLYSFEDIVKLKVVRSLREAGLSLQRIRSGLRKLPKKMAGGDPLLDELLVTDGKSVFRRLPSGQLADVLAQGQLVLNIVQIGRIRQETERAIVPLEDREKDTRAGKRLPGPAQRAQGR